MTQKIWKQTIQTIDNGVYKIILNRPEKLNAFSSVMYHEVKHGVLIAGLHPEVSAVLIEGQPGAFGTGGDLEEFQRIVELPPHEFVSEYVTRFDESSPFRAILDCPKPVVAKVDGLCLAGGLLIAATSDVVIATERSRFGVPEGLVGLADAHCTAILPLSIGLSRARYMMLTAEMIDGQTAREWGLVHKLVPQEELDAAVDKILARLRRVSPQAQHSYKKGTNSAIPHMSVEPVLQALSENGREGLRAFVEKREPVWNRTIALI